MAQEAITEIDMDIFSRRVGPYFTWLESKIESGRTQSDSVKKDVLKEVRYLATNMRARFILGLSREDFTKEVRRTLELFELATEAFPEESEEVETKTKHFCKGISEELGLQFLPEDYRKAQIASQPAEKIAPIITVEKTNGVTIKVETPKVKKEELKVAKKEPEVKEAQKPTVAKVKIAAPKTKPEPVKAKEPAKVTLKKPTIKKTAKPKAEKQEAKHGKKTTLGEFFKRFIRIDL